MSLITSSNLTKPGTTEKLTKLTNLTKYQHSKNHHGVSPVRALKHSNGEKNPKIATTITPDLHQYVKNQSKPHGSVASYLKYLILKERDTTTTTSKPLLNLPPVPSRKTINLCPTEEYAHLHNQLIAVLKQKFREKQKEDRKNEGGENKPNQKTTPNNIASLINNVELKTFYKLFETESHSKASFII